ncbi:hypothetical protein [Streptomyces hokutonensis]|uniref:hypothetical protein n=1 Tax=Streptomyces hokutonensis TaxID=1306990 RepID=UPI0003A91F5C|nr:hypothetical protein [Streptomyces hokutonensis]
MKTPTPDVSSAELVTAGQVQYLVTCPACGHLHRHLDTGNRRAPCGARYTIASKEPRP